MIWFAFDMSITLGIIAAYHRIGSIDNLFTFVAATGIALPNFIFATWRLLTFGFQNGWGLESKWIIGPNAGRRGLWGPRNFRSSPATSCPMR